MQKLFLFLIVCLFSAGISAQNQPPLPIDANVRKGTLPNGLTYYIRHNEQPKQRAEFHIAQNVGAILEQDNQNGLAHFLEHMAFNGSEHFPDKLIINYFENIGVSFGNNINAYTSLDETVYRLSDVPTVRESIIDSALLVLYDWSCGLTLNNEEIDAERGVILEEWRTRATASRRMWKQSSMQKYAGSQYAKRDVIGDTSIIKHFEYQTLKDYYKKWYGPDLQAILVVGDIDVDKIEQKIIELFGKIPARTNRDERPIYYLMENDEPIVSIVTDKEAQNSRITLEITHKAKSDAQKLSYNGYVNMLANNLISQIFSYRIDELTQNPNCPFTGAYVGYGELTKGNDALRAICIAKEGKERAAFKELLIEIEKTERFGFINSEIERAKTDMLNDFEKSFNERNNRQNIALTREYIRNYLESECIPGIEWEFETAKNILPNITKETLDNLAKNYLIGNNFIIDFQMPEKEDVIVPTKNEIISILSDVKNLKIDAPKDEIVAKNIIEKTPKAGKITKISKKETLGTTEWLLSNGVKVVIKPTELKKDEILVSASSWGGTNVVSLEDLPSAKSATSIVNYSGLGKFSAVDLKKILTGKSVSVSTSMTDTKELIDGSSSVKDFETLLQLIYLNFTSIRKDDDAFNTMIELYKNSIANREKQPKNIFRDTLLQDWSCHNPRNMIFNMSYVSQINNQKALDIFKQRFSNANDFTFIFVGNINPDDKQTQKLICTWLGALPKGKTETYIPYQQCHPKGKFQNHFLRNMEVENSTNAIRYYAPMEYNQTNDLNMEVLGKVLNIRYMESIREKEGGSYGVGVGGYMNKRPNQEAILYIQFDCNPDKQQRLLEIIHQEIDEILKNGVRVDDLQKAKESLLKDYDENIEKNYWLCSAIDAYYNEDENYLDYKNKVNAVTAKSVQTILKQLVKSGNVFEVVMNPEK